MTYQLIYVIINSRDKAHKICNALLEKNLVACCNILPGVTSYFKWEDKITVSEEIIMLLKTKSEYYTQVEALVKQMHNYDTPCIVALDIVGGENKFLKWIDFSLNPGINT